MSAAVAYLVGVILALWTVKILVNFIRAVVLRVRFYIRLKKLCSERGYEMVKKRGMFASLFRVTKKADITVEARGVHYSVRIITCFAHKRAYHFINERYYVSFARFGYVLPMSKGINKIRLFEKLKKMPALEAEQSENIKQILLLNPSPVEIFQLESNRLNKSLVTDGMEMYGWQVYSASGFLKMLNER